MYLYFLSALYDVCYVDLDESSCAIASLDVPTVARKVRGGGKKLSCTAASRVNSSETVDETRRKDRSETNVV